jgi:hypothetical protein
MLISPNVRGFSVPPPPRAIRTWVGLMRLPDLTMCGPDRAATLGCRAISGPVSGRDKADPGWLKLASPERSTLVTSARLTSTMRTLPQVRQRTTVPGARR